MHMCAMWWYKSDSWEQHLRQLKALFTKPRKANLTVNLVKKMSYVTLLGQVVGQDEITPVMAKVKAIASFPASTNRHKLMRFLGMSDYYRKFCWNFSVIIEPLTRLLKKRECISWTVDCQ